jgi:E3 ubiquitin-protein ligase UBR4
MTPAVDTDLVSDEHFQKNHCQLMTSLLDLLLPATSAILLAEHTNAYLWAFSSVLLPLCFHLNRLPALLDIISSLLSKCGRLPSNSLGCALDIMNEVCAFCIGEAPTTWDMQCKVPEPSPESSPSASPAVSPRAQSDRENYAANVKGEVIAEEVLSVVPQSQRACSFAQTGTAFILQRCFICYTCKFTKDQTCCATCIRQCHKGHDVSYTGQSFFYCDCGSAPISESKCNALPSKEAVAESDASTSRASILTYFYARFKCSEVAGGEEASAVGAETDVAMMDASSEPVSEPHRLQDVIVNVLSHLMDQLCKEQQVQTSAKPTKRLVYLPTSLSDRPPSANFSSGTFNVAPVSMNTASGFLRGLLAGHPRAERPVPVPELQARHAIAALSPYVLLVAEGRTLNAFNCSRAMGLDNDEEDLNLGKKKRPKKVKTRARSDLRHVSSTPMNYSIFGLKVNPLNRSIVAVCGRKQVHVVTFTSRGKKASRLVLDLSLDALRAQLQVEGRAMANLELVKVEWVPGSQLLLCVTTNKFVKVYDLAKDVMSPVHSSSLPGTATIIDSTLAPGRGGFLFFTIFALTSDAQVCIS